MDGRRQQDAKPLVSVVIPTYNRARYVAETIASVLAQTYENIEIIVIDDGSTDNSADVIRPFADHIRYVMQPNSERGASRNHGLRLASGKYIAFLDSDDLWLPDKAAEGVAFLEGHPTVGLIHSDAIQIDSDGKELKRVRSRGASGRVTEQLLKRNFVIMATHVARTDLVRQVGGFREERELSGSEDWEMWVRMSVRTDFACMRGATAKVRVHSANTMGDAGAMQRSMAAAVAIFRASQLLSVQQKDALGRTEAQIDLVNAINHCSHGRAAEVFRFLRQAFSKDPRIILDPRFAYTIFRLLKTK